MNSASLVLTGFARSDQLRSLGHVNQIIFQGHLDKLQVKKKINERYVCIYPRMC
jgi:hypothetical protein